MSASADATQLAIDRALDHAGIVDADEREAFAARFYRGDVSNFERAAVQAEFAKIPRADIGRPPFTDVRDADRDYHVRTVRDGFDGDAFDPV